MARLELRGISKHFGNQVAVRQFDLTIGDGELVSFLGPSGCGKTTTLRIAAGFETPTSGRVLVDGRDVTAAPPNRRSMGMVFQGYALFPNMTAASNIEFGLKVRKRPDAERRRRVADLLELFGLSHVAASYPHQMSGGQQQRVALARALAIEPSVLLLDEPLSAVDAKVREELRTEIRRMQAQLGITTVLVTHDQSEALSISDRVVVMNRGVIEEIGTPAAIYGEPRSAFTASFIGAMNEISVQVVSASRKEVRRGSQRFGVGEIAGVADGAVAALLVRPEQLTPLDGSVALDGGPVIHGTVRVQTFLGATTRLLVDETAAGTLGAPSSPGAGGRLSGPTSSAGGSVAFGPGAVKPLEGLAVDVSSRLAGRWPIGSPITVELVQGAGRVVPIRADHARATPAPTAPGATAGSPAGQGRGEGRGDGSSAIHA